MGQTTLDSLAADILGRVAVYSPPPSGDDDLDSGDPEDELEDDDDPVRDEDLEKRLDEAKHEGRLDREATTLAVLAKLVRRVPADQRAELRAEIVRHAEATVAHHLRAVVRRLFQQERA